MLSPLIYGIIIAYLLNPIVGLFDRKAFAFMNKKKGLRRLRRALSVTATMIIFLLFISLLISALAPQLISSITELQTKFKDYVETARKWLSDISSSSQLLGQLASSLNEYIEKFLEKPRKLSMSLCRGSARLRHRFSALSKMRL